MSVELIHGDSRFALQFMPSNSVDSIVTDPPYALVSISKRFGKSGRTESTYSRSGPHQRTARGFMGKTWDNGDVAFDPDFWSEALRVLKPGGHVLAFGGTRTYHRLACAVEDGGFEIRDQIGWVYGSGFPKSHNQSGKWEGWGTALKPAWEPIVVARKALAVPVDDFRDADTPVRMRDATVAENLARWGVGALNIDGCRVPTDESTRRQNNVTIGGNGVYRGGRACETGGEDGRWPANIVHDGSDEVLACFPHAPGQIADASSSERRKTQNVYGAMKRGSDGASPRDKGGSAARFFYCAKASRSDRNDGCAELPARQSSHDGRHTPIENAYQRNNSVNNNNNNNNNTHPTVKPTDLMRWLCRLVTPPGGLVLDPFMGSGSTGRGAVMEGFRFIGIEMTDEYVPIARARIAAVTPQGVFE